MWRLGPSTTKNIIWMIRSQRPLSHPDWWVHVSRGALVFHRRMLAMSRVERRVEFHDGAENGKNYQGLANGRLGQLRNENQTVVSPRKDLSQNLGLKFLIYGQTGWIGGLLGQICEKQGIPYQYGRGRLENIEQLHLDIISVNPSHVFNAAGMTGRPNVDWCESHKLETIRSNVVGTLNLAGVCKDHGLLLVNFASGCIFDYNDTHPEGSGIGYKEEDKPNYTGSFFSKTKATVEEFLRDYDNVCNLRLRMPISSDLNNPRNFIYKIAHYEKVVNIPNSMTVLDELLPLSIEMAKRNCRGIWNFTNPGVISHNEILNMYRDYFNPNFKWTNFTVEEQARVIVAPRCNNELDGSKMKKEFPELLSIRDSLLKYVFDVNNKSNLRS